LSYGENIVASYRLNCLSQEKQIMKISARNTLLGTIKSVEMGAVNSEVVIEVAPGVEITAIITKASAEKLGLEMGQAAYAIVKSSDVMIAIDHA
jgi:molybdopterin-binding protein